MIIGERLRALREERKDWCVLLMVSLLPLGQTASLGACEAHIAVSDAWPRLISVTWLRIQDATGSMV